MLRMPKYFFNVVGDDKSTFEDNEGETFTSLTDVHAYAERIARELSYDGGYDGFHVEVKDDKGL